MVSVKKSKFFSSLFFSKIPLRTESPSILSRKDRSDTAGRVIQNRSIVKQKTTERVFQWCSRHTVCTPHSPLKFRNKEATGAKMDPTIASGIIGDCECTDQLLATFSRS